MGLQKGQQDANLQVISSHLLPQATFDIVSYGRLSWTDKLRCLTEVVKAGPKDLSPVLGAQAGAIYRLLWNADVQGHSPMLLRSADMLLSVLTFVLEFAEYRPELMYRFWTERDLYRDSLIKPPWNNVGLADYLKSRGPSGLEECLSWIRNH